MRYIVLTISALLIYSFASAQESNDDYLDFKLQAEDISQAVIESDTLLFYRILHQPTDLYGDISAYNFSFVEFARRGNPFYLTPIILDGITVRSSNMATLRYLGLQQQNQGGITADSYGSASGIYRYSSTAGTPLSAANASLFFSGRGYLGGVRASVHHFMQEGWSMSAYLSAKGGNGLYIDGVSHNSIDAGVRIGKEFVSGNVLNIITTTTLSKRGLRTGSTEEAFRLIGDKLYNPSWGYQQGEVRNSRNRRDCIPFIMATYLTSLGHNTSLQLSVGGDWGKTKNSALGWYGASTPRPDNYRLMPSYYTDEQIASAVEAVWRANDSHYTQINWQELYTINDMGNGDARYAMEQRVSRIAHAELVAEATSTLGDNITLHYGVRGEISSTRNYKQMDDLMGADYLTDIDYYLMDDDSYSLNLQNNLRNPNRQITEGDRFGYDYTLAEQELKLFVEAEYRTDRWHFALYGTVGSHTIKRHGHFEKEIFAGEKSYGPSAKVTFSPYMLKLRTGYALSAQHHFDIALMLNKRAPYAPYIFLNPQYNNRIIDNPKEENLFAADVVYKFHSSKIDLTASLFLTAESDATNTIRAYDDLSATFSDIVTSEIATLSYGVELAAEIRLSRKFRGEISLGAGNYIYSNNPTVTTYADTDNTLISRSTSHMKSCHRGGVPHISSSASITYLDYRGWAISAGVNIAALRYADPAFVRRTDRVALQSTSSQEIYDEFMAQNSLGNACTVDASISRWFNFGDKRLSLTLSVKNLLGKEDIVYGGYESSRIRHYTSGGHRIYRPQDDIISYAYPRTFYFVATMRF